MIGILKFYFTDGRTVEMFINESSPSAEDVMREWVEEYESKEGFDFWECQSFDER